MLFGPLIEETKHKNFVPKISFVGKIDYATRHVVPVIFVAVAVLGLYFSNRCPYAYGYSSLKTLKLNATQIADNMVADNFTSSNMVALIIPPGDYEKEAELQQIICNRQHGGKHRFHPDSSGGAAVHVQIRCHADIADTGHSGQHMDRFLNAVSGTGLFFMNYLVVSSIQMGANIDYLENYFVSDSLPGIDGRSISGKAEPISYEMLMAIDTLPDEFKAMRLSFVADGKTPRCHPMSSGEIRARCSSLKENMVTMMCCQAPWRRRQNLPRSIASLQLP